MFKKNIFQIDNEHDCIKITVKQFAPRRFFLSFFAIVFSSMSFGGLFQFYHDPEIPLIRWALFAILFTFISVAITWYAVAIIFNKAHIVINKSTLYVSYKPIPCFRNKQIDISEINNFYIEEKENNDNDYYHGKGDVSYVVGFSRKDEKKFTITRLKEKEQAELMKQNIEECVYKQKKKVRV